MKTHSVLSPSSAHRWMQCPGSVAAERGLPEPPPSEHARLGTAAHKLAEYALKYDKHPSYWLGDMLEGVIVDEEMIGHVDTYVQYVRELKAASELSFVEFRFSYGKIGEIDIWGTSDFVAKVGSILHVVDFKYGGNIRVTAERNPQLLLYACGILRTLAETQDIETITLHICQPRVFDVVDTWSISRTELEAWAREMEQAALAAQEEAAPRVAGEHCRWCKAKLICNEARQLALGAAELQFEPVQQSPKPITTLSNSELGVLLYLVDTYLEDYCRAVRLEVLARLERGQSIPIGTSGEVWTLTPKRGIRKWTLPDEEIVARLAALSGEPEERFWARKALSPAQAEKIIGRHQLPAELVSAESEGFKIVKSKQPDFDARDQWLT